LGRFELLSDALSSGRLLMINKRKNAGRAPLLRHSSGEYDHGGAGSI
jgi:hypothetical protein